MKKYILSILVLLTTAANKDIAMIFVNTNLSAAAGAVLALAASWVKFGKPEIGMSLNGA